MGPFSLEIAGLLLLLTTSFVRDLEPNRAIGHIRLVLSVFYHKQWKQMATELIKKPERHNSLLYVNITICSDFSKEMKKCMKSVKKLLFSHK